MERWLPSTAFAVLLVFLPDVYMGQRSEVTQAQSAGTLKISCTFSGQVSFQSFSLNSPENMLRDGNRYSINTEMRAAYLTIKDLRSVDEGTYFCIVKSGFSGRTRIVGSTEVEILKLQALEIKTAQEKSTVQIDCLQYIKDSEFKGFFKDSSSDALEANKKYDISDLVGGKRLSIANLRENDQGTYTCKVMLKGKVKDAGTTIDISKLNSYAILNGAIIWERGKPANIQVAIKGKSPMTVTWYHGSLHILDSNFSESSVSTYDARYSVAPSGSLLISNVREQDKGIYCLSLDYSTNEYCTSVNTAEIPTRTLMLFGQEGTLSFSFDGDTTTTIRWSRKLQDTSTVIFEKPYGSTDNNEKYSLTSFGSLKIREVSVADEGLYQVEFLPQNFNTMIHLVVVGVTLTSSTLVVAGDNALIEAQIRTGEGQKSVTWKRIYRSQSETVLLSSILKQPNAANRHQITANGSLLVTNVTTEDAGEYCVDVTPSSPHIRKCISLNVTELCRSPSVRPKCPPRSGCRDVEHRYQCRCLPGYVKWRNNCVTGKLFEVRDLRVNETWKKEYANKSSEAHIKLVERLESMLDQGCRIYDCIGCRINELKQGSVLVTFTVIFNVSSSANLATVLQFIKALQQDSSNTVAEHKNGADAQASASSVCDINGEPCGSYGNCVVTQGGKEYHCQCLHKARKDNNGNCQLQDDLKQESESIGLVIIIVPACLGIMLVVVITVFIIILKRRHSIKAKKNKHLSQNVGAHLPDHVRDHDDVIDMSKKPRKEFLVNPVYAHSQQVEHDTLPSTVDKNTKVEPVYSVYSTVEDTYETPREDKSLDSMPSPMNAEPVYAVYEDSPQRHNIGISEPYAQVGKKFGKECQDEPVYALYG